MGHCFGVKNALNAALQPENKHNLTIAGQLVHNPQTVKKLLDYGILMIEDFNDIDAISTRRVMITAHGASDKIKNRLISKGLDVEDATCPLVSRVHQTVKNMVNKGLFPVIIGHPEHVEIKGLVGDLAEYYVVFSEKDLAGLEQLGKKRLGIISQTTNQPEVVERWVQKIRSMKGVDLVEFENTVCQPTRDRQKAVRELADEVEMIIVIGGYNSSNTKKLMKICEEKNIPGYHIEKASELKAAWFDHVESVGITAGTSTPEEVIREVYEDIRKMASRLDPGASTRQ